MEKGNIRKPAIAGSWYPGNPVTLRSHIERYFQGVTLDLPENISIMGLVVPHAGYVYSGQIAAYGYRSIMGHSFDGVMVIAPSHRIPFQGVSIFATGGYETPLGTVFVDTNLAEKILTQSSVIRALPHVHESEHSLEIQLPFLQVVLGNFTFLPILMGSQDHYTCKELAKAISSILKDKRILLVGSSDLSHFHSYERAIELDKRAINYMENMDSEGLLHALERGEVEACGGGPAAVVMEVAKNLGATQAKLLKYANSGDVTGERKSVVGYASMVFFRTNGISRSEEELTEEEKQTLLKLAREAIERTFAGRPLEEPRDLTEKLKKNRGAFVTLKKRGTLRGCIGYIEPKKPLYKAVQEMALAAAFNDPRFPPLRREEWAEVEMEISALTPLRPIENIDEIQVGKHGLYMSKGFRSGLLLPQVAVEYGWDKITFLRETCRKAGLPAHAWQDGETKIFVFSAEVFGESKNFLDNKNNKN